MGFYKILVTDLRQCLWGLHFYLIIFYIRGYSSSFILLESTDKAGLFKLCDYLVIV